MENLLKFLPRLNDDVGGGVLLSYNQDFQEKFLAENERGKIKLVLIALSPVQAVEEKVLDEYFKLCIDNGAKPVAVAFPVKWAFRKTFKADALKLFRDTVNKVVKKYKASFVDLLNVKLADKFFNDNTAPNADGVILIGSLLGARLYHAKIFSAGNILEMPAEFFNVLEKNFDGDYKKLTHHVFCRVSCDYFNRLSEIMSREERLDLMAKIFSEMTYNHLANLSDMLPKEDYNDLAERIFKISAEKISRKDKIKVGFYARSSSMWCGDDLYNLFANDDRFEPILFLATKSYNKVMTEEYSQDAEKFKAHGINVFDLNNPNLSFPELDYFFCSTPYDNGNPKPFKLMNLKVSTLLCNFSYSLSVCDRGNMHNWPFYRVLHKMFASSPVELESFRKINKVFNESRVIYVGYAKMDFFFKNATESKFDWKMARPDAKKIIWAPHHSIVNEGPMLATFQWNYQFMYDFAKNHPETSWVVKTHPNLPEKVIKSKLFPDIKVYEDYMRAWDELPNARVYMGAYYQNIFATSDGMIHDSGSFIAEYQYVDKPMIYLLSGKGKFNELGEEILAASYTIDGKDLDGIAALMQRVFIDGDDYKAAERKEVFDKYLNYPKYNGMLASEFIYKNIADELKEEPT